jgi:anaerobic ribonucleoside-triphosphate reductase
MTDAKTIKLPRVNISITGDDVTAIEQLRELLEKRLKQRLSLAQVIKRMTKLELAIELTLANK